MSPLARRLAGAALAGLFALTAAAYATKASELGLHSDFLEFYAAGRLFREDRAALYDFALQYDRQKALLAEIGGAVDPGPLPFVYPPLVAAFFAALSRLPYFAAFYLWLGLSALLAAGSAAAVARARGLSPGEGLALAAAVLCFLPFGVNCLAGGQLAGLALALFSAVYVLRLAGKEEAAGAVFALSFYKPPLFAAFLLLAALDGRRRFLRGFLAAAAVVVLASAAAVGWDGLAAYSAKAWGYRYGAEFMPGHVLRMARSAGLFQALHHVLPSSAALAAYAACAAAALAAAMRAPNGPPGSPAFDLRFAFEAAVSLLLSPHLLDYDATALLLPVFLALSRRPESPAAWALAAGLYTEFAYRPAFVRLTATQPLTVWLLLWTLWLGAAVRRCRPGSR